MNQNHDYPFNGKWSDSNPPTIAVAIDNAKRQTDLGERLQGLNAAGLKKIAEMADTLKLKELAAQTSGVDSKVWDNKNIPSLKLELAKHVGGLSSDDLDKLIERADELKLDALVATHKVYLRTDDKESVREAVKFLMKAGADNHVKSLENSGHFVRMAYDVIVEMKASLAEKVKEGLHQCWKSGE
jgi:hypothetical protein